MPLISERIIVSKYRTYHTILDKTISFENFNGAKVKNVISHKELIKEVKCRAIGDHADINAKLCLYYTYYIEENGVNTPYSAYLEENVLIRVYKKSFKPIPYETDFLNCELTSCFKNIKAVFDIDLNYSTIKINVSSFVVINLVRERCIVLEDKKSIAFEECYINQIALSSDTSVKDVKNYFNYIEDISKVLSKKLEDLEQENQYLNEELKRVQMELDKRTDEYIQTGKKVEDMSSECARLIERLKQMEEKILKEQKKTNLLEIENNRNLDEIKSLKKERNELAQKIDKNKTTLKEKIKNIISGDE